jgi:hypothetical protein
LGATLHLSASLRKHFHFVIDPERLSSADDYGAGSRFVRSYDVASLYEKLNATQVQLPNRALSQAHELDDDECLKTYRLKVNDRSDHRIWFRKDS